MVDGELSEELQYYHRLCAVHRRQLPFPIPLAIRFQKNGETEVSCSLSLLQDLLDTWVVEFLRFIGSGRALFAGAVCSAGRSIGFGLVINVKDNQPECWPRHNASPQGQSCSNTAMKTRITALARSGSLLARRRSQRSGSQTVRTQQKETKYGWA